MDEVPDGITYYFVPECEYGEGYNCTDFAEAYCEGHPNPENCYLLSFREDVVSSGWSECRYLWNCVFLGHDVFSHQAVIAGIENENEPGEYLYCVVEPQTNEVVVCWGRRLRKNLT